MGERRHRADAWAWAIVAASVFCVVWFATAALLYLVYGIRDHDIGTALKIIFLFIPLGSLLEVPFVAPGLAAYLFLLLRLPASAPRRLLAILLSPVAVAVAIPFEPVGVPAWLFFAGAAAYGTLVPLAPPWRVSRTTSLGTVGFDQ